MAGWKTGYYVKLRGKVLEFVQLWTYALAILRTKIKNQMSPLEVLWITISSFHKVQGRRCAKDR